MAINLDIQLQKSNKIYHENDILQGKVVISCSTETKHDGLILTLDSTVNLQLSNKNVGILEAFYNSVKPFQLINSSIDLLPPGKLPTGVTELPFRYTLKAQKPNQSLYETYHGVFVNINYVLKCDLKRSFLAKGISKTQEFMVQTKSIPRPSTNEVNFSISPESLKKTAKERIQIPRFLVTGRLNETICCVTQPLTGHVTIQHSEVAIKSIEIQLVRVETCGCAEGYSRDATEIQNIQIAEGNVCPKMQIPIYMIFPRLFTCPTLKADNFKVEFELNLVVIFKDDYLVTENFQLNLIRCN